MRVAETVRKRVEEADRLVAQEKIESQRRIEAREAEAAKWRAIYEDVLALEESAPEIQINAVVDDSVRMHLSLSDVKTKTDIVRSALLSANIPLKPSQIIKRVQSAMSRSGVYWCLARMKEQGMLVDAGEGRVMLAVSEQTNATQ